MSAEKVYYTDGHDVTVTSVSLKVQNKEYRLPGITRHGLSTLKPSRAPGMFLFVIGMLVVVAGAYRLAPPGFLQPLSVGSWRVTENEWAMIAGSLIALVGALSAALVKTKYAVRIATAEGENDVVVSKHREYIRQIIEGMNKAFVSMGARL